MPSPLAAPAAFSPALDHVKAAQKSLARLSHPSIGGRYPAQTRRRLAAAVEEAREAVAAVESVLDTGAGASD